jgi:hypothetical protein
MLTTVCFKFFVLFLRVCHEHNINHSFPFPPFFSCCSFVLFNLQGQFNDEIGATGCQLCFENSFATGKNRESPCEQCALGRTSKNGSTKCSDCTPGKFKNVVNNEEMCTDCPIGFAQSDTDQEICTPCIEGEEAPTRGSSFCAACDLGKFNLIAGQNCSACPAGQYQDGKRETSCKKCDADTYLNEPGKSSKADCVACSDDKSTGTSMGNTKAADCLCRKEDYYQQGPGVCQACPNGADCSLQNGISLPQLVAVNGFW